MKNYFEKIKDKLKENIKIESIELIDNSHKHKSHKFFSPKKYHIQLKMENIILHYLEIKLKVKSGMIL